MMNADQNPTGAGFIVRTHQRPMTLPDHDLGELSMGDLWHMYEAYRAASDLFGGRAGQVWTDDQPGGHILDNEADRCLHAMRCIFEEARRRPMSPKDQGSDYMARLWALHVADEECDLAEAASFLTDHQK